MSKLEHYELLITKQDTQRILSFCDFLIWKFIKGDADNLDPEKLHVLINVLNHRMDNARFNIDVKLISSLKKVKYDISLILGIVEKKTIAEVIK